MKQYKKNLDSKDELFEQRKNDIVKNSKKPVDVSEITDSLQDIDPWLAKKAQEVKDSSEANEVINTEINPPVVQNVNEVLTNNDI